MFRRWLAARHRGRLERTEGVFVVRAAEGNTFVGTTWTDQEQAEFSALMDSVVDRACRQARVR